MYTVAELFCGCGGFSHGFKRSGRFEVVLGNDIKPEALHTFAVNHATERGAPVIVLKDIRLMKDNEILEAFARKGIHEDELDCLIGGPPCQGFSQMRRGEERNDNDIVNFTGYNRLNEDPRNDLVLRFLEIARLLNPKFLVIENVPQMKNHSHNGELGGLIKNILSLLGEMHYQVVEIKVNTANYGVPQLRERLFFLASRVGPASFPESTYYDPNDPAASNLAKLFPEQRPWVTVSDAIRDLPDPSTDLTDPLGGRNLSTYPTISLSDYAARMRSRAAFPYNHITRSYADSVTRLIREMQPGETWDHASERMRVYYEQLISRLGKPGEDPEATRARLIQQGVIEPTFYKDYYWSAYTRLAWDRPALTITANANFLGSGRFTHPEQHRGITMREAARLQSFDDDFQFFTNAENAIEDQNEEYNNTEPNTGPAKTKGTKEAEKTRIGIGIDMIGEAVPPLLAETIARHVASLLDKSKQTPGEAEVVTEPVNCV